MAYSEAYGGLLLVTTSVVVLKLDFLCINYKNEKKKTKQNAVI